MPGANPYKQKEYRPALSRAASSYIDFTKCLYGNAVTKM